METQRCPTCGRAIRAPRKTCEGTGCTPIPPEFIVKGDELWLYVLDEKLCARWPQLFQAWKTAYPGLDVLAEVRKAHGWEMSNPEKRPRSQRPRFLNTWMSRAYESERKMARPGGATSLPKLPSDRDLNLREIYQYTGHQTIFGGNLMTVTSAGLWRQGEGVIPWAQVRDGELRDLLRRVKGK